MKKLIVMAFALILGIFVLNGSQTAPAQAAAAVSAVGASQIEQANAGGVTQVHRWGGPGRFYGGGRWYGGRRWGGGWGWAGGPFFWGPGPYWGPYCRWRCGPYRCWRVCY